MTLEISWERTFEFSFGVERVWAGYFEMHGAGAPPDVGTTFELSDVARSQIEITDVVEHERFAYAQTQGNDRSEMTLVFASTRTGSKITVTRYGFGEGLEDEAFRQSNPLGWQEAMQDLALYLATGLAERRHLQERSATGIVLVETEAGLQVVRTGERSLGAEIGLQPGDVLVSINGAALYERSDLWFLTRLYEPGTPVDVRYIRDGAQLRGDGRMCSVDAAVTGELGLGPRETTTSR